MSVVSVYLMGGLGNQMFQYAFGRALSMEFSKKLLLDTKTGFDRDHQFERKFELQSLPISFLNEAGYFQRFPFWTYHLQKKLKLTSSGAINNGIIWQHVVEKKYEFLPDVFKINPERSQWIFGYWQTSKYFEKHQQTILNELTPDEPSDDKYLSVADEIKNTESVAICIRQYEESHNPGLQSKDNRIKSISEINQAVAEIYRRIPVGKFYVFSTIQSDFLQQLKFPYGTKYILAQEGWDHTVNTLWLLTQFRHHVITNSSFYWWGAWLSQSNHDISKQIIYAADNFLNIDSVCTNWKTF